MNAIAAKRSPIVKLLVKYDASFSCTYEAHKDSSMGNLLSTMFDGDYRDDHAFFLILLNKEDSTSETFLRFFRRNLELLDYMVDSYECNQLKKDIRETRIALKKRKTVSSFVNGIERRIAARRALDLPMFVPNE